MIKPIAIYLPQYHSIPENDIAWGEGFTEWTNVKKGKPLFDTHYQPHIPHNDIGYYDLTCPEVLESQVDIARSFGVYGFAFYHYWFNGKRLLDTPLNNMLALGKPNFPFCFIWANEPWSKRWDGSENDIIQAQLYSFEDDLNHIQFLCENIFSDERYIKIDGKPIFIIYRTELFPDIIETVKIWRNEVRKYGFEDIFLIRVEHFTGSLNPVLIDFDAAMEFAPDFRISHYIGSHYMENGNVLSLFDYMKTIRNMIKREKETYPYFRCVFPGWDNTPRRRNSGIVFINNELCGFRELFLNAVNYTKQNLSEEKQFLFINAWNEWGEGCHIEPDMKYNYSLLEIISKIMRKHNNKLIK